MNRKDFLVAGCKVLLKLITTQFKVTALCKWRNSKVFDHRSLCMASRSHRSLGFRKWSNKLTLVIISIQFCSQIDRHYFVYHKRIEHNLSMNTTSTVIQNCMVPNMGQAICSNVFLTKGRTALKSEHSRRCSAENSSTEGYISPRTI